MTHLPSLWGRRWVRNWAWTLKGERMLEELLDLRYVLGPPPISGGARNLDAVDDQVNRGADDASLDVSDSESCMLQVLCKLDAVGTVERVIAGKKAAPSDTSAGYMLYMAATEVANFSVADATDIVVRAGPTLTAGSWITLTGVLTANSAANDDVSLYGDLTLNGPTNSVVMGSLVNAHNFRVGTNGFADTFWDGDVAFARFWSLSAAAWSSAQISQVVQAYNNLYLPAGWGPGVQGIQWILWDAAARDYSGNGLTGTYTGTTAVDDPARVIGPGGGLDWKRGRSAVVAGAGGWRTLRGVGT